MHGEQGLEVGRLMRAAAGGDEHAWSALVRRFDRVVRTVARSHRLTDTDAADVGQTTWLRLLEHVESVQSPDRVGAWLTTTARRESLRVVRSAQRQIPVEHGELCAEEADEDTVEDRLVARERAMAVRAAVERLPERQQALLRVMATDPEPSYEEISAMLGMPIGSIGPTRARALDAVRRELARAEGSELLVAA